jgi:serine/threonine-protein kinase RsbW
MENVQNEYPYLFSLKVSSKVEELEKVRSFMEKSLMLPGIQAEEVDDIMLAIQEGVTNAINHGNKCNCELEVCLNIEITEKLINISIRDKGIGFNPELLSDPTLPENIMKQNGRGLHIIKNLMDKVNFYSSDNYHELTITKFRK